MNYNFQIPQKLQRPWFNDFVSLFKQIDTTLKNEEILRKLKDDEIKNLIENINLGLQFHFVVDILSSRMSNFDTTTSTQFVAGTNSILSFYSPKRWGLPQEFKFKELIFYITIRGQKFSGTQGGEVYVVINGDNQMLWSTSVRSFTTQSYDPNWINCDYILYEISLPVDLFDNISYYEIIPYFRAIDGEVRILTDKTCLVYKV